MVELSPSRVVIRQEERRLWSASRISQEDSWREERRGEERMKEERGRRVEEKGEKGKEREEGGKITCSQLLDLPLPFPFILLSPLPPLIPPPSPSLFPPSSLLPYLQDTQDGFQLVFPQLNGRTHLPQTVDCLKPERETTRSRHLASAINKHMLMVFNGKRRNGSRRISNPQTAPDLSYLYSDPTATTTSLRV